MSVNFTPSGLYISLSLNNPNFVTFFVPVVHLLLTWYIVYKEIPVLSTIITYVLSK